MWSVLPWPSFSSSEHTDVVEMLLYVEHDPEIIAGLL
jgi:hypothetical protein